MESGLWWLEMVLGIGEGVPQPIPVRAVPPRGQGVGTVWAGKESIMVPVSWLTFGRPGAQASPGTFGLVGIQARARSLVDTWQSYAPGSARLPGRAEVGAEIQAKRRAPGGRTSSRFPGSPGALSSRSDPGAGLVPRPGLERPRSDPGQGRRHPGRVRTFPRRNAGVGAPSRRVPWPEQERSPPAPSSPSL